MPLKLKVLLTSFTILFLELVLIRFLPANVAYLGYYSNFILLASFVGMGAGLLLSTKSTDYRFVFPGVLLFLILLATLGSVSIIPDPTGEVHFTSNMSNVMVPEMVFVPVLFVLVVVVMAFVSQPLGWYMQKMEPLVFYTWDILGSLAGIVFFTLCSYLGVNPFIWFLLLSLIYLVLNWEQSRRWLISLVLLCVAAVIVFLVSTSSVWSPYQKIDVKFTNYSDSKGSAVTGFDFLVNNIQHQSVVQDVGHKEWFYFYPYQLFSSSTFNNALIIGAGTGNDVAVALLKGVGQVDAVEIDPGILSLGKIYHPNQPYFDSRVQTFVDDGRSYLEKTDKKYDLIIFALPDSLMLATGRGGIRLESFLFTKESFIAARQALSDNGIIVLYNYYRQNWVMSKSGTALAEAFGQPSYMYTNGAAGFPGVIINGPGLKNISSDALSTNVVAGFGKIATDDWPFPYLLGRGLPWRYIFILIVLLVLVYFILSRLFEKKLSKMIAPNYFFMGAAFMLLETKSVVRFSLLFGTTWLVNSLVFFAILVSIFLSIHLVKYFRIVNYRRWTFVLFVALALAYIFPEHWWLSFSPVVRYVGVSIVAFAPVFLANVIFSALFQDSQDNAGNFASNILGAAFGGVVEYLALVTGYNNLYIIIGLFYFCAFYWSSIVKFVGKARLGRLAGRS